MVDAVGPLLAGGFQHIASNGYELLFLPDLHNDELQRAGKAPVYYWMPNYVRLARMNGDSGDFKFHMIHFEGVQSADTNVGVTDTREVTGGVLTFTTIAAPPGNTLQECQNQLLAIFQGKDDRYWGWRTNIAPAFRPIQVVYNNVSLTNLSPNASGGVPSATPVPAPGGRSMNGHSLRSFSPASNPMIQASPRLIPASRDMSQTSNLDPWYFNMQGQGPGAIDFFAEQAYSGLMGSLPAAILWDSYHGATGAIVAREDFKIKVWAPLVHIDISGDWDKIFTHFSSDVGGHYLWFSADIKAEINNMRIDGTLQVNIEVDPTIPGADKMSEDIDKKTDLILTKFMEQAQKIIFDPPPPDVKPAEVGQSAGNNILSPYGLGVALKVRRDTTQLRLEYHENRELAYLQETTISSSLQGFYNEIKADPDAEKKYFTTLYLDDWDRKVTRTIAPVVNWPDKTRQWVGEPVAFLTAQVGYPSAQGDLQWQGHIFQSTDPAGDTFKPAMAKKNLSDVTNPPAGWTPDIVYIKRQIQYTEPPDETEFPYARVFVEKNQVDLDPGPNGTPTNDINLVVRADSAGKLDVGPITLNVDLDAPNQVVEVSFQCLGNKLDGSPRNVTKFTWNSGDQNQERYWAIYTGDINFVPRFQYQVHVVVKGSLFTKGMDWTGPWVAVNGNGPLIVSVPTPEDSGVSVNRDFVPASVGLTQPAGGQPAGHPAGGISAPPPSRGMPAPQSATSTEPEVEGWSTRDPAANPQPVSANRSVPADVTGWEPQVEGWTAKDPALTKGSGANAETAPANKTGARKNKATSTN